MYEPLDLFLNSSTAVVIVVGMCWIDDPILFLKKTTVMKHLIFSPCEVYSSSLLVIYAFEPYGEQH